tara:strand:+ start:39636 stop:39938 length:303 start_codon:yes stop_codon:yes gene_type:complete
MNDTLIYLSIAANIGALVLLFLLNKKVVANAKTTALEKGNLAAQISTLSKTAKEWDDQRKLEISVLNETTLKAHEDTRGELIITSPDGKTKIDEFKLKKA